jgi:hypothetical protein
MTDSKLKSLVAEAVSLDRQIQDDAARLKQLKDQLITEAQSRTEEHAPTDGGGTSWTTEGADGCIARVVFPAPKLKSSIKAEGKPAEKIKALAGRWFPRLFLASIAYKPVDNFRSEAELMLGKDAKKLIKAVESESSPTVSFETKES